MLERKPERLLNVYANYLLPPLSPPSKLIKNLAKKILKNQTTSLTSYIKKNSKEYYLLYYYILLNYTRYEVDFNG